MPNIHDYQCNNCNNGNVYPSENALQIISGKWKSVILSHLIKNKTCRFCYLNKQISDCSRRMLATQLKELEEDKIIKKIIYPVIPPKTEYQLTELGETLEPVILSLKKWGNYYIKNYF